MREFRDNSIGQKHTVPKIENRPDLNKLRGKVLAKDKHEKAVKSLEGAQFPEAE